MILYCFSVPHVYHSHIVLTRIYPVIARKAPPVTLLLPLSMESESCAKSFSRQFRSAAQTQYAQEHGENRASEQPLLHSHSTFTVQCMFRGQVKNARVHCHALTTSSSIFLLFLAEPDHPKHAFLVFLTVGHLSTPSTMFPSVLYLSTMLVPIIPSSN